MFVSKEWVLDRIEQTFHLIKKDFIKISLPVILYNVFCLVLVFNLVLFLFFHFFPINLENTNSLSIFSDLSLLIYIFIWLFSIYFLFLIIFILWIVKSISQLYNWEKVLIKENILYWFKNLKNSFKTYYYVFLYVALIPSLFIIVGWILLNLSFYLWWDYHFLAYLWSFFLVVWALLFVWYSFYRWLKSKFAIYSAVDKDTYTKENFDSSISITKNNFLRILWNIIIISMIVWLVSSFISSIFDFFHKSIFEKLSFILSNDRESILDSINSITHISISSLIFSWITSIINSIWMVFSMSFIYVFYKRLELEKEKQLEE